ncbi:MAG TPA: 2-C-methyl-D-erythritol 4-phosphate cytidylyltransferase [Burkholderiaceae bacterium]|jgi:2-C-methyl-D-erythritol 4-phosphate cytidylyltransferase|nr:2-C-methyl-D-erythritol 4-phosphate cytidylyltransferase [Burkholderiaceae bacterium]
MNPPRHFALIPAAGVGARMGTGSPKQYVPIAGKPMLLHVLDTFAASKIITHTFVVVNAEDNNIRAMMDGAPHLADRVTIIFNGGATRHVSVLKGLQVLSDHADADDWVLVHDAARPGLTTDLIEHLAESLRDDSVGGLLALPVVDTLKRGGGDRRVQATVPRSGLWAAQTPQMFRYGMLRRALEQVDDVTDESSAIEALGLQPKLVEGSPRNFKITLPQDVLLAELYLKGLA